MTPTNEQLVARFQAGDADALPELLLRNRGIIFKAIFRYRGLAEQECHDDLIQAGECGLWRAAKKFDPSLGFKFTTLAWRCVANGIKVEVRRHSTIYTPTHTPGYESEKQRARCVVRMDDKSFNGVGFEAVARFHETETPEGIAQQRDEKSLLAWAMSRLPERRREILASRLAGNALREVGDLFGITKERVRQLQDNAVAMVTALMLAKAGCRQPAGLTDGEKAYIRFTRSLYSLAEIADDLRRPVGQVQRYSASLGKLKKKAI